MVYVKGICKMRKSALNKNYYMRKTDNPKTQNANKNWQMKLQSEWTRIAMQRAEEAE